MLNEAAAHKKLGKVAHKRNFDVPVMFFGTLEIAWIAGADIVGFRKGIQQGLLAKGKHKSFLKACAQVWYWLMPGHKANMFSHQTAFAHFPNLSMDGFA